MNAFFQKNRPVFGLHGQSLGYAKECRIDAGDGRITHIVLWTQWQSIELEWDLVRFDASIDAFKLQPVRRER